MTKIEYTIKNDEKGYFGCFSKTGKNSAEILTNIRMKESLLNPKKSAKSNKEAMIDFLKRNGYHNIYGDDKKIDIMQDNELNDSVIEEMEEEIDIFKNLKKNKRKENRINKNKNNKNNKSKKKEIKKKYFHRLNEELYKYHDMHINKRFNKVQIEIPDCAKYEPNKDFVMKRIISSPQWKTRKGRTPLYKINNSKIYLNHEHPLKNIANIFIDMDKQTMRGNLNNSNDLRIITTKSFSKNKFKRKLKNLMKNNISTMKSEFLSMDKAKNNMFIKYEQNYIKSNKKRIPSAGTSTTTRPQTGIQKNLTSLIQNNSKMINNTSNSLIGNRNITSISNINKLFNEDNSSMESLTESNDSYNIYKNVYKKQLKTFNNNKTNERIKNVKKFNIFRKGNKNRNKQERPKSSNIKRKLNIKGPDFNKTMSREHYYNLLDRGSVIPFSLPNFKLVRERPLTMVVYERPVYKKYTKKEIKGITPDMYNDIYKYLDFTNNHQRCKSPNFTKINANYKTNDKNPLPIYMRGVTSRGACESINEKNLKMNNFAEGKFLSNYTSFWPKKSFNKIVNLNLLNSKTFLENVLNKEGIEHFMKKSLKFYRNNYKTLLKEGFMNKFDNVTYKTIKPAIKSNIDFEKYFQSIKL